MTDTREVHHARHGRLVWGLSLGRRSGSLAWGIVLIVLGVVLWLEQQGLIVRGFWRHGWPWLIVLLSVIQLATARTAHRVGDAVAFGLLGGWLLLVESHWRGLTWLNSWPLAMAAIGAGMVARVVAGMFLRDASYTCVVLEGDSGKERPHDA